MTSGLWRLRRPIEAVTGSEVVRWSMFQRPRADMIGGWGLKRTSLQARRCAAKLGRPYVSLEDGWLRSVRPGPAESPLSIVADDIGTHYDASRPSRLEQVVAAASRRTGTQSRARRGIELLRGEALSKYNAAPMLSQRRLGLGPRPSGGRVLVVDQTVGDASIAGGLADRATFEAMLDAACAENPDAEILVKTHPEVSNGRKRGYLSHAHGPRIRLFHEAVNPWCLLEAVDRVYVVSSQLGFEALLADLPVTCFGAPYYAGWGLTDDRCAIPRRTARPSIEQLFAALYFDYARYVSPDGEVMDFEEAAERLLQARDRELGLAHGATVAAPRRSTAAAAAVPEFAAV